MGKTPGKQKRWGTRIVVLAAIAALGVGSVVAYDHLSASPAEAEKTATATVSAGETAATTTTATAESTTAAADTTAKTKVLVIGDSIMKGFGLDTGDAWPYLLASEDNWDLTTLACNGAGFVQVGGSADCGRTFLEIAQDEVAADLDPDVIIVQGSSNDYGRSNSALTTATDDTVNLLHQMFPNAQIIGLSLVWSETTPPSQTDDINAQVKAAVEAVGGHYLDIGQPMSDHAELMQGDDVHPTAQGQVVLAAAIQAALDNMEAAENLAMVNEVLATAGGHL